MQFIELYLCHRKVAMSCHLAERLREGTRRSHTAAENTAFMKCFLKGIVVPKAFRRLLANLYFVYDALESEMLAHQDNPVIRPIYFDALLRKAALEQDLAFYYGDRWAEEISPSPAGCRYVMRIHWVATEEPALLVAHAYVRYMGDLSGGQRLKAIARAAMNLPENSGTSLHEFAAFPTAETQRAFKMQYREALNALPLDDALVQRIVDEANVAFQCNHDVMQALEKYVQEVIDPEEFAAIVGTKTCGSTESATAASDRALVRPT